VKMDHTPPSAQLPPVDHLLINIIDHYLTYFHYANALFYAERLYYHHPISEHLFLLSKCYYLQGKYKQVYHLLKSSSSTISPSYSSATAPAEVSSFYPNRYLFAMVCYQLKKYSECEESLLPYEYFNPMTMTLEDISQIPGGTNGLYLLGLICKKEQRKNYAIKYFQKCLEVVICFLHHHPPLLTSMSLFDSFFNPPPTSSIDRQYVLECLS
jgi:tetratricopeptide (TPR) repeat protein